MYVTMDPTGSNELYRIDNHQVIIFKNDQKIYLKGSVHKSTIMTTTIETVNKILIPDIDWVIRPEDIDEDAMSKVLLAHPDYTDLLVKSITLIKPYVDTRYKVALSYQRLYPVFPKIALFEQEVIDVNSDLIASMLRMIAKHDNQLNPIKDPYTIQDKLPWLLELDEHKEISHNFITNELHLVDVPGNKQYVHPLGGAFYKSTLKVVNTALDQELVEDIDYKCQGVVLYKTKISSDTYGVYTDIVFLKAFVGEVKISYHAFGGDPTLQDLKVFHENITAIMTFLKETNLVSFDTLKYAPIIQTLWSKVREQGDQMRMLLSGRPSGADVGHGGTLKKIIKANDTTKIHWWSIASLYKVDGSDEVVVADTLKIRVKTAETKFMFDAVVTVNLDAIDKKMKVSILGDLPPTFYVPYKDHSKLNELIRPQFRCIWNENTVEGSGVLLQIGMPLRTVPQEILAIENWSGSESCWKLVPQVNTAVDPEDNVVPLPAANHIWDLQNSDSRAETLLMPFSDGHLAWAGSIQLNDTASNKRTPLLHFLEKEIDLRRVHEVRFDMIEDGGNKYAVAAKLIPDVGSLIGPASFNYNGKPAYINLILKRDPDTDNIVMQADTTISAGLSANRLSLSYATIFTK